MTDSDRLPQCRYRALGALALATVLLSACGDGGSTEPDPDPPRADSVALNPTSLEFDAIGATATVTATVLDQYGDPMGSVSVVWASDNPLVASVSQSGVVTSVGDGQTRIRAQAGSERSSLEVEVQQEAADLVAVAGDGQQHWTGFLLPDSLVVRLTDGSGTPVVGAGVTWEVLEGDGQVFPESNQTDEEGEAFVFWLLGDGDSGEQTVSATSSELDPVEFSATGSAALTLLNTEALTAKMLDTLAARILARDSLGVPEPGIPVEFEDITGFGEVVQGPTTTDVNGEVEVKWQLGPTPGPQMLTVARGDIDWELPLTATATGTLDPWPFRSIAPAFSHTCGILTGGEAYCWGRNLESQLALEDTLPVETPTEIPSALTWDAIDGGEFHTCALASAGGSISCWGTGFQTGVDGDGTQVAEMPTVVAGGPWTALTAGRSHNCALKSDETAWCWGVEEFGQLGNGAMDTIAVPALVQGEHNWAQISAGHFHTCGITTGGQAYCWGRGEEGQLGNGGVDDQGAPVLVAGGNTWSTISAGRFHTCAIAQNGDAFCWGEGGFNQLGNGTTADQTSPVKLAGSRKWSDITAGQWHSCGVDVDDKLYCWGRGGGFIGLGPFGSPTPAVVLPPYAWRSVTTQGFHTCAVNVDGGSYCWGPNESAQLGIGGTTDADAPRILVRSVF